MAALGLSACMPRGTGEGGGYVFGIPDPAAVPGLPDGLFALGVASGDPWPDGFVIWTRLAPDPTGDGGGMPEITVPLRWQVATDPGFADLVADGEVSTTASVAHSAHVTLRRLAPNTTYWYRFTTGGQTSPVGRTRTAPAAGAPVDQLKMVFATCQHYESGYYTAWSHAAAEAPDVVVFLGDYIYEGGISSGRPRRHNSSEIKTLDAYRKRYGLYKSDHRLQEAHHAAPWILTWDDHEVENNYAGPYPQDPADDPIFAQRRIDAYQAYWEHQPLRVEPAEGALLLYRSLQWGSLVDFHVLDGRQYRSDQACSNDVAVDCADRTSPSNTMLGSTQKAWLQGQLASGGGRWSVLANQVAMTPMPFGTAYNMDQWDGYPVERSALLSSLAGVRNAVVLTGDFHAAGVGDLQDETTGSPIVGTELMTTSISSNTSAANESIISQYVTSLPQWRWFDATKRGYARATITPDTFDVDFMAVDALTDVLGTASVNTSWRISDGAPGAVQT
ncbi:MAG: alkaline phosphatase D family protein [Actinobacteria bacterium]|nr:alkaline phosphatase D family protein [Actinomycetota bacterium]